MLCPGADRVIIHNSFKRHVAIFRKINAALLFTGLMEVSGCMIPVCIRIKLEEVGKYHILVTVNPPL
jgi:hypothetical protein